MMKRVKDFTAHGIKDADYNEIVGILGNNKWFVDRFKAGVMDTEIVIGGSNKDKRFFGNICNDGGVFVALFNLFTYYIHLNTRLGRDAYGMSVTERDGTVYVKIFYPRDEVSFMYKKKGGKYILASKGYGYGFELETKKLLNEAVLQCSKISPLPVCRVDVRLKGRLLGVASGETCVGYRYNSKVNEYEMVVLV